MASTPRSRSETGTIVSRNPATLAVIGEVPEDDAGMVERAVADARAAQSAWADRGVAGRLAVLDRFADMVFDRREEIAETIREETGRSPPETTSEVSILLDIVSYLDDEGPGILAAPIDLGFRAVGESKIVREPLGVVGVISPWNLPVGIPATQVIPALFAGNAVVLKPAEETPFSTALLADLLHDAGVPADVLQVVQGGGPVTGAALVEADVDHVTFTGSAEVGTEIARSCRARGIPTCREQGGSDPAIVLEDADLAFTTEGVVWARFAAGGQACCAIKRLYAHREIYLELTERVVDRVERLRVGHEGDYDVGPLIRADAVELLHDQVQRSVEMGAEVLTGGQPVADLPGHFYEPTVLTNVTSEMPVIQEETFGPVLPIVAVEDVDEAVELANDTRYGLSASVWTRDTDRGERIARRIDAGTVHVNEHIYTFLLHATPWGGYGDSGGDFAHGSWGIDSVTRLQHVHVAGGESSLRAGRVRNVWWFPYDAETTATVRSSQDLFFGDGLATRLRAVPKVVLAILGNR